MQHDLNPYLNYLKYDGTHILVGLLEPADLTLQAGALVMKRRVLAGSLIGGMQETQEVLDFCAGHSSAQVLQHQSGECARAFHRRDVADLLQNHRIGGAAELGQGSE